MSEGGSRLTPLFAPRGVAVVGASRDPTKLGSVMLRSLRRFPGSVVGVNPRDPDPASGRHESLAEAAATCSDPLDLVVVCVPAAASATVVTQAAAAGARAALVCAAGFAEADAEGAAHQSALAAAAADAGVILLGPNTSGFFVPSRALVASFVPGASSLQDGPVAVVAASGGMNHALAFRLAAAGVGISLGVGLGNAVDVGTADVLEALAGDDGTRAVALHIESVPDGPALTAAVARLSDRVPVVALVVGRHDVTDFARSHTGALATSWRTTRAALRAAGALPVDDERQLIDAVTALSRTRLRPSPDPGVGIVTAQAGPALLHIDDLRGRGVSVPRLTAHTQQRLTELLPPMTFQANPVDTGRPGASFEPVVAAVAADPGIALVSVFALSEPDALDLPESLRGIGAPVVVGLGGPPDEVAAQRRALAAQGIAALDGPSALSAAVTALVEDARLGARLRQEPVTAAASQLPAQDLDEDEAKQVLTDLGISTMPRRACRDRSAAHRALAELGGPVVVKILDAAVTHKSDIGGVHLGVRTPQELDVALDALEATGASRVLVESMAPPGVDLIVGATRDPVFGPVVLLGLGGVAAEVFADVAVTTAPLSADAGTALAGDLQGQSLLDGARGGPVADRAELGLVVARVGAFVAANPDVTALEINPLRVTVDGLVALDAVLTIATQS